MSAEEEFEEWWKLEPFINSGDLYGHAKAAWLHQQEKIDRLREALTETLNYVENFDPNWKRLDAILKFLD